MVDSEHRNTAASSRRVSTSGRASRRARASVIMDETYRLRAAARPRTAGVRRDWAPAESSIRCGLGRWRPSASRREGHVTPERTARRLLVVRLRVEVARLEAEHPAHPRLAEAREELRKLTGAARIRIDRAPRCGGSAAGGCVMRRRSRLSSVGARPGLGRYARVLSGSAGIADNGLRVADAGRGRGHRSGRHPAIGRDDETVPGVVRAATARTKPPSPRLREAGGQACRGCPTAAIGRSGTRPRCARRWIALRAPVPGRSNRKDRVGRSGSVCAAAGGGPGS